MLMILKCLNQQPRLFNRRCMVVARMLVSRYLSIFLCVVELCYGQVTFKKNCLLSRKRRYLLFPEGSNFVTTMSFVKSVMIQVPKLINVLGECDVPFKLPSDPRTFRTKKLQHRIHYRQRREVYSKLEEALTQHGLNGNACVKRMICDVKNYIPVKGKSLVGDILSMIFTFAEEESFEDDDRFLNYCHNSTYDNCKLPLLDYIIGSLINDL